MPKPVIPATHRTVYHLGTGTAATRHIVDCNELVATGEYSFQPPDGTAPLAEAVTPESLAAAQREWATTLVNAALPAALTMIAAIDPAQPKALEQVALAMTLEAQAKIRGPVIQALDAKRGAILRHEQQGGDTGGSSGASGISTRPVATAESPAPAPKPSAKTRAVGEKE